MTSNYLTFFNLNNNFGWDELDNAYQSKLNNLRSLGLSDVDLNVYMEQVGNLYRDAKRDLTHRERYDRNQGLVRNYLWNGFDYFDRLERRMNQQFNYLYERLGTRNLNETVAVGNYNSESYREVLQPDGSTIVVEERTNRDNNGQTNSTRNSYRRLPNGQQEPVDYNEALRLATGRNQSLLRNNE